MTSGSLALPHDISPDAPSVWPTVTQRARSTRRRVAIGLWTIVMASLASGCATVTSIPLDANGARAVDKQEGIRHYVPRPYLLVVPVSQPAAPPKSSAPESNPSEKPGAAPDAPQAELRATTPGKSGANAKKDGEKGDEKPAADTTAASGSDTEFYVATPEYVIKLIYLPDYSQPMAFTMKSGLFGSVSAKPVFQSGWMLTGLDASADSKGAEVLASVAAILGVKSAGGESGGGGEAEFMRDLEPRKTLSPGLYRLEFTEGMVSGMTRIEFPAGP